MQKFKELVAKKESEASEVKKIFDQFICPILDESADKIRIGGRSLCRDTIESLLCDPSNESVLK